MKPAPHGALRVNVVSWDGGGLGTDIDVITAALERAGCIVRFKGRPHRRSQNRLQSLLATGAVLVRQKWTALTRRPPFDVNLFVESIFPAHLATARTNCLFVNPEWFREHNLEHFSRLDFVLCKTPSAVDAFRDLRVPCRMVAFTSPDKRIPGFVRSGPIRCLHLSGQSAVKGSEAVVEAWSHHPEWPELTVVRRAKRYGNEDAPPLPPLPNVRYETDRVPAERLRQMQNECEVHVLPSQAEAYGHVIGEAMSCGAIVVTTDAAPMNELVTRERGTLVRVARSEPMRKSTRNFVDVSALETELDRVFAMTAGERAALGRNARAWYEAQDMSFRSALGDFLRSLPRRGS
jgi:glycosyltransferase involved in cell wall biosynthesis